MKSQQEAGKLPHPAHRLVTWYKQAHRQLPWRNTKDPYRILVSETMLQQTRVETVIPYYHAFLERFPDISSLAAAEEDEVLKQWQGLGYYSRARNLKKAAEVVVSQHGGVMPDTIESLLSLPGVGPYTAGAVASIAFDKPAPAVDGNVLRVIARFCGIVDPIDTLAAKRKVTEIVSQWGMEEQPSLFTQSIMELGATVCTPRSPKCDVCPLKEDCVAYLTGQTDVLPLKTPKKPRKIIRVIAFWLENEQGILLEKRPNHGLLAGMWQLPSVETDWKDGDQKNTGEVHETNLLVPDAELDSGSGSKLGPKLGSKLDAELDSQLVRLVTMPRGAEQVTTSRAAEEKLRSYVLVGEEKHIFTHIEWRVQVFRPVGINLSQVEFAPDREMMFVQRAEIRQYVLPRVYEKIIGSILGERVR
jgi:A/G-specific adenine glycosylase